MTAINQNDVMNALHNLMGHRTNPGGTDEDFKRYIQDSFDYCWRYYRWGFSLKKASVTIDVDDKALLPEDFDYDGYRQFDGFTEVGLGDTLTSGGSAVVWDDETNRYMLEPAIATTVVYQTAPPTLSPDTKVPFPSAMTVAIGATVLAKQGANPTRADIQQEWDMWHSRLDRLVARSDNTRPRRPTSYHDMMGSYVGNVG